MPPATAESPSERRRPFGYKIIYHDLGEGSKRQRRTIGEELEPAKADAVREPVSRVLRSESLRSIAFDFNKRGIKPAGGKKNGESKIDRWQGSTLRRVLISPRIAGRRVSRQRPSGYRRPLEAFTRALAINRMSLIDPRSSPYAVLALADLSSGCRLNSDFAPDHLVVGEVDGVSLAEDALHELARSGQCCGRMVIIGDAAHAPSPSSGQGAAMALEDAVGLAQALRDHAQGDYADVPAAFAAYEKARRERVEKIVAAGARSSSSKIPGPVGRRFQELDATGRVPLHDHRPQHQLDQRPQDPVGRPRRRPGAGRGHGLAAWTSLCLPSEAFGKTEPTPEPTASPTPRGRPLAVS